MAANDRAAARGFATSVNTARDANPIVKANMSADRGLTSPVTMGRPLVRAMSVSMSRSMYMLNAFAEPALSAPPTRVPSMSHTSGTPRAASTITGAVVTRSSSITRGFMRAMYAPIRRTTGAKVDDPFAERLRVDGATSSVYSLPASAVSR
ncbi:unannotated protein [freshwater metagenome]|uniref:Unannotated protein n=1 Tax=freshwater metagenome TaxID=449393 RepID=A0A6J6EVK1_9ZZZZ